MIKIWFFIFPSWACVTGSVLVPRMENGAARDFCMRHQMMPCKGGLLFSFCSTLPTPHLGTTEGQSGREMETERKTEICGRAKSSAEQWKHLHVSQTFTHTVHSHSSYITFLSKMKNLFWMQWFKVQGFSRLPLLLVQLWKALTMFVRKVDMTEIKCTVFFWPCYFGFLNLLWSRAYIVIFIFASIMHTFIVYRDLYIETLKQRVHDYRTGH